MVLYVALRLCCPFLFPLSPSSVPRKGGDPVLHDYGICCVSTDMFIMKSRQSGRASTVTCARLGHITQYLMDSSCGY